MSFQIKAEVLLNNSNWEKNLRKTSKQMEGFGKSMKTISNGVKAAWAGVAALGVGMLFDAIVDVTKAAAQDAKSQALLNAQLQRNWHTNQAGTKAIEGQIDALSNMSGIADDNLRPALQKIVAVTKNSSKGMKAFALAMDVSAGTGKDLNVVSQAMAKYLGGNKKGHFKDVVNASINSTLSRTLNTSLMMILVLLTMFLFGGESIRGFIFAMLVGIVVGTYSSLFIATPVLVDTMGKADLEDIEKRHFDDQQ
jgi:hypothetical protein